MRITVAWNNATFEKVKQQLKSMTLEGFKTFTAEPTRKIFHATVGPLDGVYCPAGWMFAEQIKQADYAGVRLLVLPKHSKNDMISLVRHLQVVGKPNEVLAAAADAVTLAEEAEAEE